MNRINQFAEEIDKLLNLYFKDRKLYVKNDNGWLNPILQFNFLTKQDNEDFYKINFESKLLGDFICGYIENKTHLKFKNNIKESFELLNTFEKDKKVEYNHLNVDGAYSELTNGLKSYILCNFHSKNVVDIFRYYFSLDKKEKRKIIYNYLRVSLQIEISSDNLLILLMDSLELSKHKTIKYINELCITSEEKASKLFDYVLSKSYQDNYFLIIANLFFGLYDLDKKFYSKKDEVFQCNVSLGYFVLGRLKFNDKDTITDCFNYVDKIQNDNQDELFEVPYLYKSLIENEHTTTKIRTQCFNKLKQLFITGTKKLKSEVFEICSWIKGYEVEKYDLLYNVFLSKPEDFLKKISAYFIEFKDPKYFFHLYTNLYLNSYRNGNRFNPEITKTAFLKFWRKQKNSTINEILYYLSHNNPICRLGAANLLVILNKNDLSGLDLLTLENENEQMRALEVLIFVSYYDIELILKIVIQLEKSSYPRVIEYLQEKLSELIFYSYHDFLYKKIEQIVTDVKFMEPLKKILSDYHSLCHYKEEINDLNPIENEKNYMTLYYRLETETNRKMLQNYKKDAFWDLCKHVDIIRGNSWKIGDNEVSPLAKIEKQMPVDMDMYRNPDLYDFRKNNFQSEF